MNKSTFRHALTLAVLSVCVANHSDAVQAQPPNPLQLDANYQRSSMLLGIPTSFCGHVMDLMMHNRIRQQMGRTGTPEIHLPHLSVGSPTGDLALCGIHLVTPETECVGPVFQVTLQNNSTVPIGNFAVTIVGVLGQITPTSPMAEETVPRMEPGQQLCVTLQLPVTCLSMGPAHQRCCFDTLVVAVDSQDCLIENNELNNIQIVPRTSIGHVVVTEQQGQPQPPASVPLAPATGGPEGVAPMAPGERNPLDNVDLDHPDRDQKQSLRLSFR